MKLDLMSLYFNSVVITQTGGQASWATSLGQEKAKGFPIQMYREGMSDLLAAMLYNCHSDIGNLHKRNMSENRELLSFSVFEHILVNGCELPEAKFIMAFVREHTKTSNGKLHLCYAPYFIYKNDDIVIDNSATFRRIAEVVGCGEYGCWFARKIKMLDQKTIDFRIVLVDPIKKAVYKTHKERSDDWDRLSALSLLEEECISISKDAESFYKYLTLYLPDRIGTKVALGYCRSLSTKYINENIHQILGNGVDNIFDICEPDDILKIINTVEGGYENIGIYAGIPVIALKYYYDFLIAVNNNKNVLEV